MRIELQQGSQEWHDFRKNHIGASDAPVIMGVSPWRTPYQLWKEKTGIGEQQAVNVWMQRGIDGEEEARQAYIAHTGTTVTPAVFVHDKIEYLSASLDGISDDGKIIVEIKRPGEKDHATAKEGSVPEKYFPQCQQQLFVSNADALHYWSFRDGDFALIIVERDEEYIKTLIEKACEFWDKVIMLVEPEKCKRDEEKVFVERSDSEWEQAVAIALADKAALKEAQAAAKESDQRLIDLAAGNNCKGFGLSVQKVARKGTVNYTKIPELKDIDLEAYRKPSTEYWKVG